MPFIKSSGFAPAPLATSSQPSAPLRLPEPPPPPPPPKPSAAPPQDSFTQASKRQPGATLEPTVSAPPASTLMTENIRDGQANCLDKVGDWLELASPQIRARSEVLILSDNRPGAEGQTGHAVIRQGNGIFDPSTGRSYPSFEAFNADGRYSIAGKVNGPAMQRILSAPPGSAARQQAIARAGVDPALASMLVADSTPVDTRRAWAALAEGYRDSQSLGGAVESTLR